MPKMLFTPAVKKAMKEEWSRIRDLPGVSVSGFHPENAWYGDGIIAVEWQQAVEWDPRHNRAIRSRKMVSLFWGRRPPLVMSYTQYRSCGASRFVYLKY